MRSAYAMIHEAAWGSTGAFSQETEGVKQTRPKPIMWSFEGGHRSSQAGSKADVWLGQIFLS